MILNGHYLTLYVADRGIPGPQYDDSQTILDILKNGGVNIDVKPLDLKRLNRILNDGYFRFIVGDEKVQLPLLESVAADGGIFTGFMGIEGIVGELQRLNVLPKENCQNKGKKV